MRLMHQVKTLRIALARAEHRLLKRESTLEPTLVAMIKPMI